MMYDPMLAYIFQEKDTNKSKFVTLQHGGGSILKYKIHTQSQH